MSQNFYSRNRNRRQATSRASTNWRAKEKRALARSQDPNLMLDLPSDPDRAFAEVVFRQLGFLGKMQIMVLINSSTDDAQRLADQNGDPVAVVDERGLVLSY